MQRQNRQSHDRIRRVTQQVYQVVAAACLTELNDPRLNGIQITDVHMTRDLGIVRIYFHLLQGGAEERSHAEEGLRSASGYLKRAIGQEMKLKFMPEVEVFYDEGIDRRERIDELLQMVNRGNG